jgi:hypothetical protein
MAIASSTPSMLEAIQSSALSQLLVSDRWVVTAHSKQILETLHFIAFALQIGAVMVIALRLLGFGRHVPIAALRRPVFRTAWVAFAVVLLTGLLQFAPIAAEVVYRPSFRAKIALLTLALGTLVLLQTHVARRASDWDLGAAVPGSVKVLAVFSLALWPTVIVVARLMYAFVQMAGL